MDRLALADSFFVDLHEGVPVARRADLHFARFTEALHEIGYREDPHAFVADGASRIAAYARAHGPSFPRVECWESAGALRLDLSLRPAPERTREIALVTVLGQPRAQAHLKGPHIAEYSALTRAHGAEVLLVSPGNAVIEGTTTSLVWWDGDTIVRVAPDAQTPRVASITEALVSVIASDASVATRSAHITPTALALHEVWAVNALHGIRPVTELDGVRLPAPNTARLTWFRDRYAALARPL